MIRRILRGGSFLGILSLRTSLRNWSPPENRFRYFGFRLVIRRTA